MFKLIVSAELDNVKELPVNVGDDVVPLTVRLPLINEELLIFKFPESVKFNNAVVYVLLYT